MNASTTGWRSADRSRTRMSRSRWPASWLPWLVTTVVSFVSLGSFLFLALSDQGSETVFWSTLLRPAVRVATLNTITIGATVSLLCVVLGLPVVYWVVHAPRRTGIRIILVVVLSGAVGMIVRAYAWFALLGRSGPVGEFLGAVFGAPSGGLLFSRMAVVLALTQAVLPVFIIVAAGGTFRIARSNRITALSLGASEPFYFTAVFLPQARTGVVTGVAVAFLFTTGAYVLPELLGGGGGETMMLGVLIDEQINALGDVREGGLLALLLAGLATTTVFAALFYSRNRLSQ